MRINTEQKVFHTLHIVVVMCFIGHGAFGLITKEIWCNYFAVFGIGREWAYRLMPIVGSMDIFLGIVMLFYPNRAILLWLLIWATVTASLRPLSGEPVAELIERAGNFGAPLALLLLTGGIVPSRKNVFNRLVPELDADPNNLVRVAFYLRLVVFLLLLGHGWLNILGKKALLNQYDTLGIGNPVKTSLLLGSFEIATACLILVRPLRPFLFMVFIWKMFSELFYPHYGVFEWIERGGSYGALLALWFAMESLKTFPLRNGIPAFNPFRRKWSDS
jgi:hypothetical protein